MSKDMISIGSVINYPSVHNDNVLGKVEVILQNTVIVRDSDEDTHLILKSSIQKDGFSVDEETARHQNGYRRK